MEITLKRSEIESALSTFLDSMKANTGRAYRKDIGDFLTFGAFDLAGTIAYFDSLARDGYSASTIERKRAALSKFFAILAENGMIASNPFRTETFKLSMRKNTQTAAKTGGRGSKPGAHHLSESDLSKMITLCDGSLIGLRNRAILLLGAREGLRRSEISALRWNDIEQTPEGRALIIRGSKSGITERVKLFEGVYQALAELRATYRAQGIVSEYVIASVSSNGRGSKVSGVSINETIKALAIRAGVLNAEEITAHDLRHTAAVSMHTAGVPVSSISRMLRHKDIKVTMIYLETLGLHEDKALNGLAW